MVSVLHTATATKRKGKWRILCHAGASFLQSRKARLVTHVVWHIRKLAPRSFVNDQPFMLARSNEVQICATPFPTTVHVCIHTKLSSLLVHSHDKEVHT